MLLLEKLCFGVFVIMLMMMMTPSENRRPENEFQELCATYKLYELSAMTERGGDAASIRERGKNKGEVFDVQLKMNRDRLAKIEKEKEKKDECCCGLNLGLHIFHFIFLLGGYYIF